MRHYETLFVLKPTLTDEERQQIPFAGVHFHPRHHLHPESIGQRHRQHRPGQRVVIGDGDDVQISVSGRVVEDGFHRSGAITERGMNMQISQAHQPPGIGGFPAIQLLTSIKVMMIIKPMRMMKPVM